MNLIDLRCCGVLIAVCLISSPAPGKPAIDPELDARWDKLGARQERPADDQNPVLAILKAVEAVPEHTRNQFLNPLRDHTSVTEARPKDDIVKVAARLQEEIRKLRKQAPGAFPPFDSDQASAFHLLTVHHANQTLAAHALQEGQIDKALDQLESSYLLSDFLAKSQYTLMEYAVVITLKRMAFKDLLEIYAAHPDRKHLDRISTITHRHRYRSEILASALQGEARLSYRLSSRLPEWLQEYNAKSGTSFWKFLSKEPLASCTLEQLLAMNYDPAIESRQALVKFEQALAWCEGKIPLIDLPGFSTNPPEPKPLTYYQSAPNGLGEIFRDCQWPNSSEGLMILHQTDDALAETCLAWLRAEADGLSVTSLNSLVPNYLSAVPRDPCDGKPLRARPAKRILYSIGVDLVDDGGQDLSKLPLEADLEDLPETTDRSFLLPTVED